MTTGQGADAGSAIDTSVPHSARVWNYWLGGKDNYPVDRQVGDLVDGMFPHIKVMATESRAFLRRVIRYLAGEAGVSQFLDVGTGLPTSDNTHEVAQRVNPRARIVYVDNDPLVLAHANALLTSTPQGTTTYVHASLYEPAVVLEQAREDLDFGKPVALNLSGILGHVADLDQARSIVRDLLAPLPAGSYLTINDGCTHPPSEDLERATREYNESGTLPYYLRSPAEIASFFDGLDLVEPGVVMASTWRPDPGVIPARPNTFGGLARKP
jgi:hypothetical protein